MFTLINKIQPNAKNDILSGMTVALALVPEAVAFAFVAGVEPMVGLHAAFMMGILAAIFGGRPGMISGSTGAMAVVVVALVAQ
ncbi:MAG: SulP family sulfate permease, partial [Flavobacteriales bacterium]